MMQNLVSLNLFNSEKELLLYTTGLPSCSGFVDMPLLRNFHLKTDVSLNPATNFEAIDAYIRYFCQGFRLQASISPKKV